MQAYEYRVVPAPRRGEKARGARSTAERLAVALARVMNDLGAEGWEYLRADTLPCDERVGLTGTATSFQNLLVFRRALAMPAAAQPGTAAVLPPAAAATPAAAPLRPPAPPLSAPEPGAVPAAVVPPLPPRAEEGNPPALGPALPPLPSSRPNGRI